MQKKFILLGFFCLLFESGAFAQTTYSLKAASQAIANTAANWNTDATGGGAGKNAANFIT